MIEEILKKAERGEDLDRDDIVRLLSVRNLSEDYFRLMRTSRKMSEEEYGDRGYIFYQIGIDSSECPGNCRFCSLASMYSSGRGTVEKSREEILEEVRNVDFSRISALFLMTTACYDHDRLCSIARDVRRIMPDEAMLVANCGDFGRETGRKLRASGFDACYHIVRLREGEDTEIPVSTRLATIDAAVEAGMELFYCIEPVGREHSYEEIAREILRARDFHVKAMAVMSRVPVRGTDYENVPEVDEIEMGKIASVVRIAVRPAMSMNVHEPKLIPIMAGVNQLYSESGSNPRDSMNSVPQGRGRSIDDVEMMLRSGGFRI